jgi:hypothetical protein
MRGHVKLIAAVVFGALFALAVAASVIEWRGEPVTAKPPGTAPART